MHTFQVWLYLTDTTPCTVTPDVCIVTVLKSIVVYNDHHEPKDPLPLAQGPR